MQTIELTDKELQDFYLYKKHKSFFNLLITHNVHNMRNGNAVLSFNPQGHLVKVKLEQVVFYK